MVYLDIKIFLEENNIDVEFYGDFSCNFESFVEFNDIETATDFVVFIYTDDIVSYQTLLEKQVNKNFLLITNQYFDGVKNQIVAKNSKHIYHHIRNNFLPKAEIDYVISDKAVVNCAIDESYKIAIGPFTVIDKDVSIGNNVRIGSNVSIKNGTIIKDNVVIEDNVNIGFDAFSFYEMDGEKKKITSIGGVIIEEDVYISPGCIIDKGIDSDTIIGKGTKMDSFIFIGHDCIVGKNNVFPCGTIVAGFAKIGNNNYFGINSCIRNQAKIGNDNLFGMGSVIVSDFDDSNVAFGNPAKTKRSK